jgi:hypothetical protein
MKENKVMIGKQLKGCRQMDREVLMRRRAIKGQIINAPKNARRDRARSRRKLIRQREIHMKVQDGTLIACHREDVCRSHRGRKPITRK